MAAVTVETTAVKARPRGFVHDLGSVATRAIKLIPRDPAAVVPALVVPLFFFVVNVGSLQNIAELGDPDFDYKAFQLPVAIVFAVTGISRASTLVLDITGGYFDRMLMTPLNRMALLLGLMVADFVMVVMLSIPVVLLGFAVGVRFETGLAGIALFILLGACWGVAFTGFPYAVALRTGSPAAVNSSFILFFPFAFLTTAFMPEEALTGWLATIAHYNPVTYLLAGLRSLIMQGWDAAALGKAFAAVMLVALVSQFLAFSALRNRVKRG
jgi:ABC-2 type transport system permease protein